MLTADNDFAEAIVGGTITASRWKPDGKGAMFLYLDITTKDGDLIQTSYTESGGSCLLADIKT